MIVSYITVKAFNRPSYLKGFPLTSSETRGFTFQEKQFRVIRSLCSREALTVLAQILTAFRRCTVYSTGGKSIVLTSCYSQVPLRRAHEVFQADFSIYCEGEFQAQNKKQTATRLTDVPFSPLVRFTDGTKDKFLESELFLASRGCCPRSIDCVAKLKEISQKPK